MIIIAIAGAPQTSNHKTLLGAMGILRAIGRHQDSSMSLKLVIRKSIGLWLCQIFWELTKLPAPLTWEKGVIKSLKIRIGAMSSSPRDFKLYRASTRAKLEIRYRKRILKRSWPRIRPNSQHFSLMSLVRPQSRWFNSQASLRSKTRSFSTTKTPLPHPSSPPRTSRWPRVITSKGHRTLKIQTPQILKWLQHIKGTWTYTLKNKK